MGSVLDEDVLRVPGHHGLEDLARRVAGEWFAAYLPVGRDLDPGELLGPPRGQPVGIGAGSGLIMGLWSFAGPFTSPALLGDYADVSRRLARLGHIAFFGLGILNILLARELPTLALGMRAKRAAAAATC